MEKIYYPVKRFEQKPYKCGPAALAQLMSFFGTDVAPEQLIKQTVFLPKEGVFVGNLARTAIDFGCKVRLDTFDLAVFDPTWQHLSKAKLMAKLHARLSYAKKRYVRLATEAYISFLRAGGRIEFPIISKELLLKRLQLFPLLISLSSTFLYCEKKWDRQKGRYDDLRGKRLGHYVVVNGYDRRTDKFFITDPWNNIPFSKNGRYKIKVDLLVAAMFAGEPVHSCTIMQIRSKA